MSEYAQTMSYPVVKFRLGFDGKIIDNRSGI